MTAAHRSALPTQRTAFAHDCAWWMMYSARQLGDVLEQWFHDAGVAMAQGNETITIRPGQGANAPATFDPADLIVKKGDIVSWSNVTPNVHELVWIDENGSPQPIPSGGPIPPDGQSDAVIVDRSFQYRCSLHANETGSVTVAS
jgi:plastocyanin